MNADIGHGIHAMQFAFFDAQGRLDREAMRQQAEISIAAGAHGIALLGLATEVHKLSLDERHTLIDWISRDIGGRVPFAVTIAGAAVAEQVRLARHAADAGADWLILQPPPERGRPQSDYVDFFSRVMEQVDLPVAIQNAPEYTGIGLDDESILALARSFAHFRAIKAEGPATAVQRTIEAVAGRLRVLNGRGGLELLDNLRAGCVGMIPATDTLDFQVRIFRSMNVGADAGEAEAEAFYRRILPAVVFAMQSLDSLICYGKRIAAIRLGLGEVHDRAPAMQPTAFGLACARRFADELGLLPGVPG